MNLIKSINTRLDNWYDKKYIKPMVHPHTSFHRPKIIWNYNEGTVWQWYGKIASCLTLQPIKFYLCIQFPFTKIHISLSFSIGGYGANW